MTIYLSLYIIFYIATLLNFLYLMKSTLSVKLTFTSIPYLIYYLSNFSKFKNYFLLLFLALTGLPPFLLFFIKFNFLINIVSKLNFIMVYLIFLIMFIHMIFYIQTLVVKNTHLNFNSYEKLELKSYTQGGMMLVGTNIFFFFFSILFFQDIFIVFKILL